MRRVVGLAVVGMVFGAGMGQAPPALSVGSQHAHPGTQGIRVPITLQVPKGVQVSAIQAELHYDAGSLHLQAASAGPAAERAGKQLSTNTNEAGVVKLLLFGMNRGALSAGVVASVTFDVAAGSHAGTTPVRLVRVAATDVQGRPIALQGVDGHITIQ